MMMYDQFLGLSKGDFHEILLESNQRILK